MISIWLVGGVVMVGCLCFLAVALTRELQDRRRLTHATERRKHQSERIVTLARQASERLSDV